MSCSKTACVCCNISNAIEKGCQIGSHSRHRSYQSRISNRDSLISPAGTNNQSTYTDQRLTGREYFGNNDKATGIVQSTEYGSMAPDYLYTSPMYRTNARLAEGGDVQSDEYDEISSNNLYEEIAGFESDVDHYAVRMEDNQQRPVFY